MDFFFWFNVTVMAVALALWLVLSGRNCGPALYMIRETFAAIALVVVAALWACYGIVYALT